MTSTMFWTEEHCSVLIIPLGGKKTPQQQKTLLFKYPKLCSKIKINIKHWTIPSGSNSFSIPKCAWAWPKACSSLSVGDILTTLSQLKRSGLKTPANEMQGRQHMWKRRGHCYNQIHRSFRFFLFVSLN